MSEPSLQLNDFHRNTLLAGFKYMDRLLSDGFAGLEAGGDGAIFAPTAPDSSPVQRKVIADQAARLRRAMRSALEAFTIPVPSPDVGALWNLRSMLISVEITLEEMGPDHLRGYGAVDGATAAGVTSALAQIRVVLAELQTYLGSGLGGDLTARLARLDQTRDEVRLLRELDRIITAHGLVELRGALGRLLERLERNWWIVAFVGRVSSGKSSLLNHLLATDLLPAGVTPVTAVPIRIVPGAAPAATVFFATQKPVRMEPAQLAEYAAEEHNPGNVRQVTDILLEMPGPRLAGDMCFVDTPGLGSLATAGAAQTLAFLPRCDLGVLLLEATTELNDEDVAVARTLLENGAEVLLVLSKSDLLGAADREKVLAYVRRQFAATLGRELLVAPVSVAPGHAALADDWFIHELTPRQARHHELAAAALRRKIGAMGEAVVGALAGRAGLDRPVARAAGSDNQAVFGAARAALDNTRNSLYDLAYQITPSGDRASNAVADSLAARLGAPAAHGELPEAMAHELGRIAARMGADFDARLRAARDAAAQALAGATGESVETAGLPQPSARPLFDPASVLAVSRLTRGWRRWPLASLRRTALRHQLRSHLGGILDDALRAYARTLVSWSERYLHELTSQFNAQAGFAEVRSSPSSLRPEEVEAIRREIDLLRTWNARSAA